jgi:putative salt-induced outer membrane protein
LTTTTSILEKFLVEAGSQNTFLQNDLALQVKINTRLALAVGYSVRDNTNPPTAV